MITSLVLAAVIGALHQPHTSEAGCAFQLGGPPEDSDVFQYDFDAPIAWLNLDGKDVKLTVDDYRENLVRKDQITKGDRRSWKLSAKGVKVTIESHSTTGCDDAKDDACEASYEDATITVMTGHKTRTTRVKGNCGT
jgi:hypothetical protein